MESEQKRPYKVYQVGGLSFFVYLEYDGQLSESYPAYPDFEAHPAYTDEGRPYATAEQGSCPHRLASAPDKPRPSDCGGCYWFYREQTPYDPIGICMCDVRRHENELETERNRGKGSGY